MRRTKEWWARLTKGERIQLVGLERAASRGSGGTGWNLPPGYNDCPYCSTPSSGGLCRSCLRRLIALIDKANGTIATKVEPEPIL